MGTLADVAAQLTALENTLTSPPTGASRIRAVYDEPPASISVFPCFVNLEEEMPNEQSVGYDTDYLTTSVGVWLLCGTAAKYSLRDRRLWVAPVIDLLNDNPTLNGAADSSTLVAVTFETLPWNGVEYVGARFLLHVNTVN